MNTFQLSCFLAVAETLSFARAAEQLNITQPAVTHQIHTLESELNVKLFHRTTKRVNLTSAGALFFNDAQSIVSLSIRAKKRFENPIEQEIQLFSIGCHGYMQLFPLSDVIRKLVLEYPNLHPRLQVVPFQYLYRLLEEEDVDVIVGFQETDTKRVPGIYKELCKIPIVCSCSKSHPLASRKCFTIDDLKEEKLILSDPMKTPPHVRQIQVNLIHDRNPSNSYFCESIEASTVLARAGLGISVLPDLFTPPDTDLVRIPIKEIPSLSFGLYYKTLQGNDILKSFVKNMKIYFSKAGKNI